MALLVREVGVAILLCFYPGRRDMCIYLLSLLRGCFHVGEIGRVPSINNIRSVSTMTTTTADSAMCIFYLESKLLFTGINSSNFSFRTIRIAEKVDV